MNEYSTFQKRVVEFIHRYIDEVRLLATAPNKFYHERRDDSGFLEPTLFAGVSILLPILFYCLLTAPFTLGLSLLFVLPSMIYGVMFLFISAIILHGLVRIVGGQDKFETTYRSIAYASAASYSWLIPLPFVNLLLFAALFCTLLYFALREAHELNPQQTSILLIAPAFIILLSGAILTMTSIWMIFKGIALIASYLLPG
ncbi:MAG: YIP1 family protein [Candidatus Omnitrophica bacterium]|nr:YIP1 family protein [Candidatus Omnitrophota bacterium]